MADAAVFDVDTQESMQRWNDFHARTAKPGIALSVTPHQIDGTVWVQKPVTPAALLAAAAALNAGKWHRSAPAAPVAQQVAPMVSSAPLVQVETRRETVAPAPVARDEVPPTTVRPDFGGLMRQVLNPPPAAVESHKPNFERFVTAASMSAPAPAPAPVAPMAAVPAPSAAPAPAPSDAEPISSQAVESEHASPASVATASAALEEPVVAEPHDPSKQDLVISQQEKHDEELLCGTRED
ncbi:MAG: hypothetical protein AB3X37_04240, partial [Leptothrix ochracea]